MLVRVLHRGVFPCIFIALLCAAAPRSLAQEQRGLVRYGNLIVRHHDIAAIVVTDPRPKFFSVIVYCRQATGEIAAIPGADVESSAAMWRAFATLPTPQQRQEGLVKCGELLIVRAEAISAVVRRDIPDNPGTIAQVVLQLDAKPVEINVVENVKTREQLLSTWTALTSLAEY